MKFVLCVDLFDSKIVIDIKWIEYFIMINRTDYILIRVFPLRTVVEITNTWKLVNELLHVAQHAEQDKTLSSFSLSGVFSHAELCHAPAEKP